MAGQVLPGVKLILTSSPLPREDATMKMIIQVILGFEEEARPADTRLREKKSKRMKSERSRGVLSQRRAAASASRLCLLLVPSPPAFS